jgi:hypothetical protein
MRAYIALAGIAVALAWSSSASAQTQYNIIQPSAFQNTSVTRSNMPVGGPAAASNSFKLTNLFYRGAHVTGKPTVGASNFPTPAQMQALSPAYMNYFGVQRPITNPAQASPWTAWLSAFNVFGH